MSPEIQSPSAGESPDVGSNASPQQDAIFTEQVSINGVSTRYTITKDGGIQVEIPPDMDDSAAEKWKSDPATQNQASALSVSWRRNAEAKRTMSTVGNELQELQRLKEELNGLKQSFQQVSQPTLSSRPQTFDERLMGKLGVGSKDDLDLLRETDQGKYHSALFALSKEDAIAEIRGEFQGTIEQMTLAQEITRDGLNPTQFQSWCASKGAPTNRAMYDLFKQMNSVRQGPSVDEFNRIASTQGGSPMFIRQGNQASGDTSSVNSAVEGLKRYAEGVRL
jgi:hypothetical protein